MSDPKGCPMAFVGLGIVDNKMVGPFGACSQNKCAWWVEVLYALPNGHDPVDVGHCVIRDIGRGR
jgi:hypothetical protein